MLVTLVAQGLTLTPLVRRLEVGVDVDERLEADRLRGQAMHAAVLALRDEAGPDPEERHAVLQDRLHAVMRRGDDVEREVVLTARATGTVTPAAADEVLHDIEVRAARSAP